MTPVEITLRNMHFHVRVGILEHEAEYAQPLEVDLTVWASYDRERDISVDYRRMHASVAAVLSQHPLRFIEAIAFDIASDAMTTLDVRGARATVRKPHVALGGALEHAEVVIELGSRQ